MAQLISVVPNQCELVNDFIQPSQGRCYFEKICREANWQQQTIKIFGKSVLSPRLTAWYGDKDAMYCYSGTRNVPQPWFDELLEILDQVEAFTQESFNSVLLNLYRNGNDSMGSHSDNEAELGIEPTIASVSLGATRRFILHSKLDNFHSSIKLNLHHGSLLLMSGAFQSNWKHSVPKTKREISPRINLTFRRVETRSVSFRTDSASSAGHLHL